MAFLDDDVMQLLRSDSLAEMYIKSQKGSELFQMFDSLTPEQYDNNVVKVPIMQQPATQMAFGKPGEAAPPLKLNGNDVRIFEGLYAHGEFGLSLDRLHDSNPSRIGSYVKRKGADASRRLLNAKQIALVKTFLDGYICMTSDNKIVDSTSANGYKYKVDFEVPSSQFSNCGGIIDVLWSDPSADIQLQLDSLNQQAVENGSPRLKHIFVTTKVKDYLRKNTLLKGMYQGGPLSTDLWQGSVVNLNGFTWHFTDETYPNGNESVGGQINLIPDTRAIITPDPSDPDYPGWFVKFVGPSVLHNDNGLGNPDDPLAGTNTVYGDFSYAYKTQNPRGVSVVLGSNFFYGLADTTAVYSPTIA